jgi:spore germination cell wall hydrolase CwlJ-like protein
VISPLLCVAMAVYFEARGEQQVAGLIAVAEVIENRVQDSRFPDDHCSVVKQGRYWGGHPIKHQCQFTFYCDRKPETVRDHESWRTALLVASKALNGEFVPVTHGANSLSREVGQSVLVTHRGTDTGHRKPFIL